MCALTLVAAPPPPTVPSPAPAPAVPVHIAGIRLVGPEQVMLILADEAESHALPIAVGREQGLAIYLGREKAESPRPMTHDLLVSIVRALDATVERITVTDLRRDTYFAEISLRAGGRVHAIDARPSDAIALAVRLDAPIFASPALLRPLRGGAGERIEVVTRADRALGLSVQELDADLAESLGAVGVKGVLVASVGSGGPAERAGLKRGDILLAIDARPTGSLHEYDKARHDAAARFYVWRDGGKRLLLKR